MSQHQPEQDKKTVSEEIEVAGNQLVDRIQEIIRQGNVRRLIIRSADDRVILETSLTVGAVAGGALAIVGGLPLAIIAAIAAAVARVKVEIVREVEDGDVLEERKRKVEIASEDEE
jgi:hypothetical protein